MSEGAKTRVKTVIQSKAFLWFLLHTQIRMSVVSAAVVLPSADICWLKVTAQNVLILKTVSLWFVMRMCHTYSEGTLDESGHVTTGPLSSDSFWFWIKSTQRPLLVGKTPHTILCSVEYGNGLSSFNTIEVIHINCVSYLF